MVTYKIYEAYFNGDVIEIKDDDLYRIYLDGHMTTSDEDFGERLDVLVEKNGSQISVDKSDIVNILKIYDFDIGLEEFENDMKKILKRSV